MRISSLESRKADIADIFFGNCLAFGLRDSAKLEAERHVAKHVCPGQQREILEDEGAVRPRTRDLAPVDLDLPVRCRNKPRDDFQKCRLSATGR
ncbi:MAG: hypothetical protein MI923_03650, partial [Phycisphaerales bacterium]|nr:hypothetical protein [Phycisphaerales bacterium]